MLIHGISNRLDAQHYLFFYEFDNIPLGVLRQEMQYIANLANIDIFIFESSKNNYHVVSFDILLKKTVISIQNQITLESDYIRLDESTLYGNKYGDNCLRLSSKGKKQKPKFKCLIRSQSNVYFKHAFSLPHMKYYEAMLGVNFEDIINYPEPLLTNSYKVKVVFYHTMQTKRKKWLGGNVKKGIETNE